MAWFPAAEFDTALIRWPHLGEAHHWATADHVTYNHRLERHLRRLSEHAASPTSPASVSLWIAPIELEVSRSGATATTATPPPTTPAPATPPIRAAPAPTP